MSIQAVIELLRTAERPSRALDQTVAQALGWRVQETIADGTAGKRGEKQIVWIDSRGREAPRAPFYTTSLHALFHLAVTVAPKGGASWEDGMGSAKLGDGPTVQARTPELALCIAVLMEFAKIDDSQ